MSEYQIRTFTDWKKELVQKNQEQKKDPNYNNEIIDVIN
jgi:hypothetical protein